MKLTMPVINWYKLGLYAALFTLWTGGVYGYATYSCKKDHLEEKVQQAEAKTKEVIKEVEVRIPVVQLREVESAKQRAEIDKLKGELDATLTNQTRPTQCDLSDAEFDAVNGLLRQTRKK